MSEMIELCENELQVIAGGQALSLNLQENINVNPQVAVGIAVLSEYATVIASNYAASVQVNVGYTA